MRKWGYVDRRKPFRDLRPDEGLRLGGFAIGVFYIIFTIWTILHLPLFTVVGVDFRALFASARIATTSGFAQVYDLAVQTKVQQSLMAPYATGEIEAVPTPFLPVFILPFLPFLPLGVFKGFIVWTVLNAGGLAIYLRRLADGRDKGYLLSGLAWLSLPVFLTLLLGQVNVWLLICVVEFLSALKRGRGLCSGFWLGGLLLKPQTLILLIPALLLRRRWDILAGFTITALGITGVSLGLAGLGGMTMWWGLLARYADDLPATDPLAMANFRMVGECLSLLLPPRWAWGITGGLSVAVALLALWVSLRKEDEDAFLLPLLAATCAVIWHSHIHMAAILIPPLFRQVAIGQMSPSLFIVWTLMPPAVYFLSITGVAVLTTLGRQPPPIPGFTYPALVMLGLHLHFTFRAVLKSDNRVPA